MAAAALSTDAMAVLVEIDILGSEWVAIDAMHLVLRSPSTEVHSVSDSFQMAGVHAGALPAQVVDHETLWDLCVVDQIRHTVSARVCPLAVPSRPNVTVAVAVSGAGPQPAGVRSGGVCIPVMDSQMGRREFRDMVEHIDPLGRSTPSDGYGRCEGFTLGQHAQWRGVGLTACESPALMLTRPGLFPRWTFVRQSPQPTLGLVRASLHLGHTSTAVIMGCA